MSDPVPWYVYLLECRGGRIYTGVTPDLARRLEAHRCGRGARFTRMYRPERLLAARPCATRGEAQRLEIEVKNLAPARKRELAADWSQAYPADFRIHESARE